MRAFTLDVSDLFGLDYIYFKDITIRKIAYFVMEAPAVTRNDACVVRVDSRDFFLFFDYNGNYNFAILKGLLLRVIP